MKIVSRIELSKKNNFTKVVLVIFYLFIILFSLSWFISSAMLRPGVGNHPDVYPFYTGGQLWNEGLDPYDYDVYETRLNQLSDKRKVTTEDDAVFAYPPQGASLFSLLAKLPFTVAQWVMLGANLFLLVVSLCMLAFILSWYRPIGILEVVFLVSLINTSFGRSNVRNGQISLIVCVLLLATFIFARFKRKNVAGLMLAAATFKPSFLPLYVIYYLLRRSYRLVAVFVLATGLLTTLPVLLTQRSLVETITGWVRMMPLYRAPGSTNDPSPFFPLSPFLYYLEPLVYRVFNNQSSVTTAISWLIVLTLWGCTAYLIVRSPSSENSDLLDFGLVSVLSLLSFTHHDYDIFLLFPGLLYLYVISHSTSDKTARRNWGGFLVIIILLLTSPVDLIVRQSYSNPALQDSYLWRLIAPYQAWVGVTVLGALLWLKVRQVSTARSESHAPLIGRENKVIVKLK